MVFHGNCARGRTGHMIKRFYLLVKTITVEPLLSGHLLTGHPQAASCQSLETVVGKMQLVKPLLIGNRYEEAGATFCSSR